MISPVSIFTGQRGTIRQRVEAMIQIAHPKFRPELEDYAEKNKLLSRTAALA